MLITEYITSNWILILVLLGFAISLISTVFMDRKIINSMYLLIVECFILSIVVFAEFKIVSPGPYDMLRLSLMAIRYTSTPLILAQVMYIVKRKSDAFVFVPVIMLALINLLSIFTGIVFSLDDKGKLVRGPLGLLPYIAVGIYSIMLIFILIKQNRRFAREYVPIIFFAFAFASGLIMPFLLGKDYAPLFSATIAVSTYVYYVFSILQLTKRDSLTGLLNRQAYYADIGFDPQTITAIISIDMNGLKTINDVKGHEAGDIALKTITKCFTDVVNGSQHIYRTGGDEFIIVCRKINEAEVINMIGRIQDRLRDTIYTCSIGYSFNSTHRMPVSVMVRESDKNMYNAKMRFYKETNGVMRCHDFFVNCRSSDV